jgi:hypothetical protein
MINVYDKQQSLVELRHHMVHEDHPETNAVVAILCVRLRLAEETIHGLKLQITELQQAFNDHSPHN